MSKLPTEAVWAVLVAAGLNDDTQRSALGIARSWMDSGEIKGAGLEVAHLFQSRDRLAGEIVAALEGFKRSEQLMALATARERINAPYVDPTMLGFQAARARRGVVGSVKKNEKNAGKS